MSRYVTSVDLKEKVYAGQLQDRYRKLEGTVQHRHMMISNVRGGFGNVQGTVTYDSQNVAASKVDVQIDATTINSLETARETHLKSADSLHVEKYATITFKSKAVTPDGDGELRVKGDLTIHGATQGLACALAQSGISVIGIDRRVEQQVPAGNDSAALNKIRDQLL